MFTQVEASQITIQKCMQVDIAVAKTILICQPPVEWIRIGTQQKRQHSAKKEFPVVDEGDCHLSLIPATPIHLHQNVYIIGPIL